MSPIPNHPKNRKRWREEPELSGPAPEHSLPTSPPRRLSSGTISFLTSFIVHTTFLLILALIVIKGLEQSSQHVELQASILPNRSTLEASQLATVVIAPPQLDSQESQAERVESGDMGQPTPPEIAEKIGELQRFQPEQAGAEDANFRWQQSLAALALASATTDVESTETESGKPGEATFFGSKAYGNRFVFIIDASTSMEGFRWNRAVGELLKCIGQLSEGTEFYIIAFNYEPLPIDLSRAVTKSFLVKGKGSVVYCRKWLRSLVLAPETMPAGSLELALAFEPDAIFLLSDGELRDNSLGLLRKKNQRDNKPIIPINTIHLFSDDGKETLETLARENGGSFTAVGGKE